MTVDAQADIFGAGRQAWALAQQAFDGRGCFVPASAMPAGLLRMPFTFGEPEAERRQRLASLARKTTESCRRSDGPDPSEVKPATPHPPSSARRPLPATRGEASGQNTEDTEKRMARIRNPETPSPRASVSSALSVVNPSVEPPPVTGLVPTPVGEPQGLDTIAFFAACRLACPQAHLVVDLDVLGHKLGQLCLSFGADTIMGAIVDERAPRLGSRVDSRELTRDEAAQMLRASGFAPCEQRPDGKVCQR